MAITEVSCTYINDYVISIYYVDAGITYDMWDKSFKNNINNKGPRTVP